MSVGLLIAVVLLGFVATPILGLVLKWVDRLVTARIQWRKGPPPYQTFADVLKLLGKETMVSEQAASGMFLAAPLIGFIGVGVSAAILWAVALQPEASFVGDLIVVVYFLVFPAVALILGGSASGTPHASVGASREMKLVIAYELPFILALAAVILTAAARVQGAAASAPYAGLSPALRPSFNFSQILRAQAELPLLCSLSGALAFLCMLPVMQAKLGLVPFDQAEAETELMGGAIVEYSGPPLAMIYLTRATLLFVLPMFVITVFWGGIHMAGWGILTTILKLLVLIVVIVLVRNTSARLRIDQAMRFFWFIVTPVALIGCAISLAAYYGG